MTVATNYNSAALEKMIEETAKAAKSAQNALTSAENSEAYLKAHPEAGGSLASDVGGSVFGKVGSVVKKAREWFQALSKELEKLRKVKEIYDKAVRIIAAFNEGGLSGAIGELTDVIAGGQNTSILLDAVANGNDNEVLEGAFGTIPCVIGTISPSRDNSDVLEEIFGTAGDVAAAVTGKSNLSNMGNMAHAYTHVDQEQTRIWQKNFSDYRNGDASLTETVSSSMGASVAAAGIGTIDAMTNFVGIDIPDSWSTAVVEGGAAVGKFVGDAVNWGLNGLKSLFRR